MGRQPRTGISRIFRTEDPGLGDRVVVRRRLPGSEREVTDVVGHIVELSPLRVRPQEVGGLPSRAPAIEIDDAAVLTVRLLPERTVKNSEIRAVEVATARAFPGTEHALTGDGQWLLRHGDGITERSNSATPVGPAAGFQAVPVAEILEFYARRHAPAILEVPERIARPAERLVGAAEWRLGPEVIVMTRGLGASEISVDATAKGGCQGVGPAPEDTAGLLAGFRFEAAERPGEDWYRLYHFRGRELPRHALEALRGHIDGRMVFGAVRSPEGTLAAITRGTITKDDVGRDWLGLSAVEVAPRFRRLGLGSGICRRMLSWGAAAGATGAFLQVIHTNRAGVALYRSVGFSEHHRHRYAHRTPGQ